MSETTSAHVIGSLTQPIQLGWCSLYEPSVFKKTNDNKKTDDDSDTNEDEAKAKFTGTFILDKELSAEEIERHYAGIEAAEDAAIAEQKWIPKFKDQASLCFKDADNDYVQASQNDDTMVLLADKTPRLIGKCRLTASAYNRPTVKYLDEEDGLPVLRELPTPILNPDPDDKAQVEEAAHRKAIWDQLVFPGQNVVASFTYRAWKDKKNAPGVSATLDNLIIVGGGQRRNIVPFDSDFQLDDAAKILAWRKQTLTDYEKPSGLTFDDDAVLSQDDKPSAEETSDESAASEPVKTEQSSKQSAKSRKKKPATPRKEHVKAEPAVSEDEEDAEFDLDDFGI